MYKVTFSFPDYDPMKDSGSDWGVRKVERSRLLHVIDSLIEQDCLILGVDKLILPEEEGDGIY